MWLPYVSGTYDEFVYERVMARRREFRCLLGSKPEWRDDMVGENEGGIPIDDYLVTCLQVNLGPS